MVPFSHGGATSADNMQILCSTHNRLKHRLQAKVNRQIWEHHHAQNHQEAGKEAGSGDGEGEPAPATAPDHHHPLPPPVSARWNPTPTRTPPVGCQTPRALCPVGISPCPRTETPRPPPGATFRGRSGSHRGCRHHFHPRYRLPPRVPAHRHHQPRAVSPP
ncbi:HNH endonuclease signature motif containing protein [Nocardiopsis sp. NPDC055879]